jgi:RNA-directed DNA polymerase
MKSILGQRSTASAEQAKQGAEMPARTNWTWVEAGVWTERMLSALGNGVKGGKNAYFADAGPFALHTAWQIARQSR